MRMKHYFYQKFLEDGEEIVEIAYRHWIVLKMKIWKASSFCIMPSIILFIFFPYLWPILIVWFLCGVVWYFLKFMEWYYDCFILTNIGIIDVERHGVFHNTAKRIDYNTIDGVSYTVQGFLPTILNYGDITIDKMGSGVHISLEDAAKPQEIERKIVEYQEKYVKEKTFMDHEALKGMLADMIATHVKKYGIKQVKKPSQKK